MNTKQEIIMHLRAIADLLEQESEGVKIVTQGTIDFPSDETEKKMQRKRRFFGLSRVSNIAQHYKVTSEMIRAIADGAGVTLIFDKDDTTNKRPFVKHEDVPRIEAALFKKIKWSGKTYRQNYAS